MVVRVWAWGWAALQLSLQSAVGLGAGADLDGSKRVGEGNRVTLSSPWEHCNLKAAPGLYGICPLRDQPLQCKAQAALASLCSQLATGPTATSRIIVSR